MNIGVVGLGRVGLPLALVFAKSHKTYGVDLNSQRCQAIIKRALFEEPQVNEYLEKYCSNLSVSTRYNNIKNCKVIFVIVHTPSLPSGKFDLQYVEKAVSKIHKTNETCLIVVSSTINIGDVSKLRQIHDRIVYNPCMIRQGSIIHDFEFPKYIMIGSFTEQDFETVKNIWQSVICNSAQFYRFLPEELEVTKLSLNVWLALQITVANVIGELCKSVSVEPQKTLEMLWKDIRNYNSGLGFSGVCLPRDVNCLKQTCIECSVGSGYRLTAFLNYLNNYTIEKYHKSLTSYGKKKIGILGLAYKPNVPYIDESQSLKIAKRLLADGYEVFAYDELAEENARKELTGKIHFCSSAEECVKNSDIIFIGTSNFKDMKVREKVVLNPWK